MKLVLNGVVNLPEPSAKEKKIHDHIPLLLFQNVRTDTQL